MSHKKYPGEFEHMVLLAILQCGDEAFALEIRDEVKRSTGRSVSRGAFYTTLQRLEAKGFIDWIERAPTQNRGGPTLHRRYRLTSSGIGAVQDVRKAFVQLWRGLDRLWETP